MIGFYYYGFGNKKSSKCRTFLKEGNGKFLINKKNILDYFKDEKLNIFKLYNCLEKINYFKFDISSKIKGGGKKSQIDSIMMSLSKAIIDYDKKYTFLFKKLSILKDTRITERKKIGFKKSRKKKQFSKR